MRNFQQKKNKWRKIFESPIALIFLFVLMIVFASSIVKLFGKMQDTREKRSIAEEKVAELRAKKEKLSKDIAHLETDKGIEENIREKFGLVKEGEEVIVIVEDENTIPSVSEENSRSFLNFFKSWFK